MDKEIALEVRDLTVSYRIFDKISVKNQLFGGKRPKKNKYFEALRGITFSCEKGSIVGIIGKNGSGKSTLLNTIAGIFSPDSGSVDLKGNSVSILSIGVGFKRELSGRKNIVLSGLLLGFSEEEIQRKMPAIIDFAELGDFIDMPVRTYSSGMHSKLAFSIAVMLETDIILIDEALSVGDIRFRKKSYNKMRELILNENHTVLIASHMGKSLQALCDTLIWIDDGQLRMQGSPRRVLAQYNSFMGEPVPEPKKKNTKKVSAAPAAKKV